MHGGTSVKKRKFVVAQFQDEDGPPFFILSLKAGGTGLNLTAADTVLILPSASLLASQQQLRERIDRMRGRGLPGVQRR
jgi:hypothetical protein